MSKLSFKIAYPIIIAGLFIIVSFIALNYNNLNSTFYLIFSFLVIYIFLFGFATGQNFVSPVKKLLQKADELSRGDLKSRFYLENKDEFGQLANIFNRIADQLEESSNENEKIKKSVGIKVEAETQSLKETINALEKKIQNRTFEIQKMMGESEKFKEYSRAREAELLELKNQILALGEKLEKRDVKKKKPEKLSEDLQVESEVSAES